jgi:ABC-type antimicrobial peptide transport system permease subunit
MGILESLLTGLDEARRHLGQTLLSLLGLILGTGSIVTVLALFGGQAKNTQTYLSEVGGIGTIIVRDRDMSVRPTARELASKRLTYDDAEFLEQRATTLSAVSPGWARALRYQAGNVGFTGQVIGTVPDYAVINDIVPMVGRYLSDLDVQRQSRVVVMGWKFADSLFGSAEKALDQFLSIQGKAFRVVGVMEREEFYFAVWSGNQLEYRNERAYIPITTAVSQFADNDRLDFMTLKASPASGVRAADAQVRSLLYARHGVEDFDVTPPGGDDADDTQFLMMFNYIFLVAGVVSLFTGGIVIANIFLASVVERVREMGTRMALGATPGGVFLHVVAEVLVVTLLGGLVGLAIGTGLTGVVGRVMGLPAAVTPAIVTIALSTAGGVGLIAGLFPALRAARISPVEALRYG